MRQQLDFQAAQIITRGGTHINLLPVETFPGHLNNLKYLVNAASIFSPKAFLDHTEEDYDVYLDLNRATFFVTQRVAKSMMANGGEGEERFEPSLGGSA